MDFSKVFYVLLYKPVNSQDLKLNELLNKIFKKINSTEMTEQDETEARCWFSHSWHEAYSLHTVWCPLQRAGFTHLVHFFKFKLSTLILPASMRELDTGCLYNTSFTKRKKKRKKRKQAEKQMFKFHWNNNEQTTMCTLKRLAYLH